MPRNYNIATIPGDGTGPEVTAEGIKVFKAIAELEGISYQLKDFDYGGDRYLATGEILPEGAADEERQQDDEDVMRLQRELDPHHQRHEPDRRGEHQGMLEAEADYAREREQAELGLEQRLELGRDQLAKQILQAGAGIEPGPEPYDHRLEQDEAARERRQQPRVPPQVA